MSRPRPSVLTMPQSMPARAGQRLMPRKAIVAKTRRDQIGPAHRKRIGPAIGQRRRQHDRIPLEFADNQPQIGWPSQTARRPERPARGGRRHRASRSPCCDGGIDAGLQHVVDHARIEQRREVRHHRIAGDDDDAGQLRRRAQRGQHIVQHGAREFGALVARQHRRQPLLGAAQPLDGNDGPDIRRLSVPIRITSPAFSGSRGKAACEIQAFGGEPIAIFQASHPGRCHMRPADRSCPPPRDPPRR